MTRKMVTAKSPGKYLSVQRRDELVGRVAQRDFQPDEPFTEQDLGIPPVAAVLSQLNVRWGLKARFHDLDALVQYRPPLIELHLTDQDLNHPFTPPNPYEQELFVHAPDYAFRSLVDLCAQDEAHRKSSVAMVQRALDKARDMSRYFQGRPTVIVHVGGMSLEPIEDTRPLLDRLRMSLRQLRPDGVELLLENLPPRPWYFGGQYVSNVFVDAQEIVDFCRGLGLSVCFDSSHAQLYCNLTKKSLEDYLRVIRPLTRHLHISDASGIDGEGLQIDEGDVNFRMVLEAFRDMDISMVPEIWRGHQRGGEGFLIALQRLTNYL